MCVSCILLESKQWKTKRKSSFLQETCTTDCREPVVLGIYLSNYWDNYYFSFCTSVRYKPTFSSFCTARDRPGTKTEIMNVTIIVQVNSEDNTFSTIDCNATIFCSPEPLWYQKSVLQQLIMCLLQRIKGRLSKRLRGEEGRRCRCYESEGDWSLSQTRWVGGRSCPRERAVERVYMIHWCQTM